MIIIVCEECQTRYNVHADAIGEDGRRVRCMNCSHEWFQDLEDALEDEPEEIEEEALVDTDEEPDIEPIPEAVKPDHDEIPAITHDKADKGGFDVARYTGYAAAAAVLFLIIGSFIVARQSVVNIWPASVAFYDKFGFETKIDGEVLIFDQVQAVAGQDGSEAYIMKMEGKILNLSRENTKVPNIQASLLKADGEVYDSWVVTPESATLEKEGEMPLQAFYPDIPKEVKELNIRLITDHEAKKSRVKADSSDGEQGDESAEEGEKKEFSSYLH